MFKQFLEASASRTIGHFKIDRYNHELKCQISLRLKSQISTRWFLIHPCALMKYGTNYSWKYLRTTDVKKILGVINLPLSFHLIRNHLIQSPWLKQKLMIQIINQNLYSFIDIKILDLELISNHAKDIIKLMIIIFARFGPGALYL